jgi:hypothetical protein
MLVDPVMAQYTGSAIPDLPVYEQVGHGGMATLWVLFILMLLSTIAFIGMAWPVPVVSFSSRVDERMDYTDDK